MSKWLELKRRGQTPADLLSGFEVFSPPVPVLRIARDLGVRLHPVPSPGYDGALKSCETGEADIWYDTTVSDVRQRFTIAHELGHLFLHPTGLLFRDHTSTMGVKPEEREANRFAAELLMPDFMLQALIAARSTGELAELFGVSLQAMSIRLQSFRMARSFG